MLKRLKSYTEGPYSSTELSEEGTIVPIVNYFEEEMAKEVLKKRHRSGKKKKDKKVSRRKEKRTKNAIVPEDDYLDSMMLLEMQMFQMDDVEDKILPQLEDKSQEEIIIDEILSLPMDTLMQVKSVPDRLLSPIVERPRRLSAIPESRRPSAVQMSRRGSSLSTDQNFIPLPEALSPSYLPTKPVSGILAPSHHTDRLYRYTHIERIVYPHERVIVPPGFVT